MAGLKLYIVLLLMLVASCASVTEMKKMDKFEQASHAYELAIRWSDFEMASTWTWIWMVWIWILSPPTAWKWT